MKTVKPAISVATGRPYRHIIPAILCLVALGAAFGFWVRPTASADSNARKNKNRRQQENPDGSIQGFAETVGSGVTVPVSTLMENERQRPKSKDETERFTKKEFEFFMERRGQLKPNPLSPTTSAWPKPVETETTEKDAADPVRNSPQTIGRNFLGISRTEAGGATPPDSHGAVGPTQVIVTANVYMRSFSKTTGGTDGVLDLSLGTFFAAAPGGIGAGLSDPRIKFDPISRRWFISIITVDTTNRILLAVSNGENITSTSSFTFFSFAATDGGGAESQTPFADYDTLGIDAKGVYIGTNMFNTAGTASLGATIYVLNKANLLAPTPTLTVTAFRQLNNGGGPGISTPYVADNPDPAATEAYAIGVDNASLGLLVIRRITGADTMTPTISANLNLTVPITTAPLNVTVQGRSQPALDALDDRLFEAKVRNGRLWTAHNIGVNASGVATSPDRTGSRWYEIGNLSATPTLIQSGTLFSRAATNPDFFWIPSIGVNGQGHAALACSAAGTARFTDIVFAGRLNGDTPGTLRTPTTAVTATSAFTSTASRWGDYSHVALDPNDDMTMWTFQEYGTGGTIWGVQAIQLRAPAPATPVNASPSSLSPGTTANITVTGIAPGGAGFYNPAAPFPNRLSAAVSGTGVTVNSVSGVTPTSVTLNVTVAPGATTGPRDVTITNPDGQTATGSGVFRVGATCQVVTVGPSTLPNGSLGFMYNQSFTAAPTGTSTFALAGGTLPTGLSLNGNTLSGMPLVAGTFAFAVSATDGNGCVGATSYVVTITSPTLTRGAVTVTTGNGLVEPNECNTLSIALSNVGDADATNVGALLTNSTSGVTITQANSTYPTIVAGGAAQTNTLAFQISTATSLACFSTINLTLTINYRGGSNSFPITLTVGQPTGTNYVFSSTTGTIPSGGTLIAGSQNDDVTVSIPLPGFAFSVYGTNVTSLTADTNGNIRINGAGTSLPSNGTLPSASFPAGSPVLCPYWDDIDLSPSVTSGGGIFTQTVGTAPNRQFIVEWRARHFIDGQTLGPIDTDFAIVFNEGSNQFSYIYAQTGAGQFSNGASATVGVQANTTGSTFTQFLFNTGNLIDGQRLNGALPAAICSNGSTPCTACTYQVAPTSATIPAKSTTGTINVTTSGGCGWTAVSNAPWLTILSGAIGSGNGTVQIRAASNESASSRVGTLTVAGQTVTLTQSRPNASTPGQYRPTNGFVYIRNTNDTGFADTEFFYGTASDLPIAGDWNGDGTDTIGIYRNGQFFLRNSNDTGFADINFAFGASGDLPIAGDWDGDGIDTVGLVRGNLIFLRNSNSTGAPDVTLVYGTGEDLYIAGDWDGDGIDTIGCFRPTNGFVYLRNTNTSGVADVEFFYGIAGDKPVAGDWNGDGIDTIGIVRGNEWFLRNTNDTGFANIQFTYGTPTDVPIVGDWNGTP